RRVAAVRELSAIAAWTRGADEVECLIGYREIAIITWAPPSRMASRESDWPPSCSKMPAANVDPSRAACTQHPVPASSGAQLPSAASNESQGCCRSLAAAGSMSTSYTTVKKRSYSQTTDDRRSLSRFGRL